MPWLGIELRSFWEEKPQSPLEKGLTILRERGHFRSGKRFQDQIRKDLLSDDAEKRDALLERKTIGVKVKRRLLLIEEGKKDYDDPGDKKEVRTGKGTRGWGERETQGA